MAAHPWAVSVTGPSFLAFTPGPCELRPQVSRPREAGCSRRAWQAGGHGGPFVSSSLKRAGLWLPSPVPGPRSGGSASQQRFGPGQARPIS